MWAIVATAIGVGGATAIGAIIGFFVGNIPDKGRDTIMGFAAGMMLAAASVGLYHTGGRQGRPRGDLAGRHRDVLRGVLLIRARQAPAA